MARVRCLRRLLCSHNDCMARCIAIVVGENIMKKRKQTRFEIARELAGGEIPDWKFENQLKALVNIIEDIHDARPLMSIHNILHMLNEIQ